MSACRTRPKVNPGGPQGGAQAGRSPGGGGGGGAGGKLSLQLRNQNVSAPAKQCDEAQDHPHWEDPKRDTESGTNSELQTDQSITTYITTYKCESVNVQLINVIEAPPHDNKQIPLPPSLCQYLATCIEPYQNHPNSTTSGWRPRHQAPRLICPASIWLRSNHHRSAGLMAPVTLHHLPGTRTPAHGTPLGDYVTRDYLVARHLAFGSRMLRPRLPDTCRYSWPRPLALVPPTPALSAYVTPVARGPCPLASRDGGLLIRERDPRSETNVMPPPNGATRPGSWEERRCSTQNKRLQITPITKYIPRYIAGGGPIKQQHERGPHYHHNVQENVMYNNSLPAPHTQEPCHLAQVNPKGHTSQQICSSRNISSHSVNSDDNTTILIRGFGHA